MTLFLVGLFLLVCQRIVELLIARHHESKLKEIGGVEIDRQGYRFIVGMHIAFFVSLTLEEIVANRSLSSQWIILFSIFVAAQVLRYWAIASLGVYWNTKIIVTPHHPNIRKGPYKLLRHPNYIAVVTEIAVIPLIFSCYMTAVAFTILNAFVLRRRIRVETRALTIAKK